MQAFLRLIIMSDNNKKEFEFPQECTGPINYTSYEEQTINKILITRSLKHRKIA